MVDAEKVAEKVIDPRFIFLSKRMKRFLAMYFPNAIIRKKFWLETNVELGDGTYLNPNVIVSDDYQGDEIYLSIGKNCSVSPGVVFAPVSLHNNSLWLRENNILSQYESKKKIIIGDDVWIGANSTILPGIEIGNSCIIGANTLVNKNIPAFSLAYGVPVKIIKDLRTQ